MAIFLGVHDMGQAMSEDMATASWEKYKKACEEVGCLAQHVHYSADKGRAYCLTEAASADEVQKAHDNAQLPLKEILEVKTSE